MQGKILNLLFFTSTNNTHFFPHTPIIGELPLLPQYCSETQEALTPTPPRDKDRAHKRKSQVINSAPETSKKLKTAEAVSRSPLLINLAFRADVTDGVTGEAVLCVSRAVKKARITGTPLCLTPVPVNPNGLVFQRVGSRDLRTTAR